MFVNLLFAVLYTAHDGGLALQLAERVPVDVPSGQQRPILLVAEEAQVVVDCQKDPQRLLAIEEMSLDLR
jgi:hypothetical protein